MVVTVSKATSAEYYTGQAGVAKGAESYYLDAVQEGEPAGFWSGSGAERLGLTGEVDAEAMTSVFSKHVNPMTGASIGSAPKQYRPIEDRIAEAIEADPWMLPEQIEALRSGMEQNAARAVIGWDATFSVPKSVTVAHTAAHRAQLAAIRSGDTDRAEQFGSTRSGIEAAILEANAAMLAYAETLAVTRTGRHGGHSATARWQAAPQLTVASFFQHTNRNIDPQLHVHNVILNRAFTPGDGKGRALDGQDLLAQKHALGAVADRVLEEALTRMGFEVELRPDGAARELTVVPTATAELFSSRRRQLTARVAELLPAAEEKAGRELTDLELHYLKQHATLATRARKSAHPHESYPEMIQRWWAESISVGADLDQVADAIHAHLSARTDDAEAGAPAAGEWSAAGVIAEAVAALGEQHATWRASDLMLELTRRLPSLGGPGARETLAVLQGLTEEAIAGPLVRQVSGRLEDPSDPHALSADGAERIGAMDIAAALAADPFTAPAARRYATINTLAAEEALRAAGIERGGHALDATRVDAWLNEHAPTIAADQRAAVLGIAGSTARLSMLIGPAGTGKSYTAGAFAHAWADLTADGDAPGRVIGLAVSKIATEVLIQDGVTASKNITDWLTTQKRLAAGRTGGDDISWRLGATDVVMVDEASMIATGDLHEIHALVSAAGARMVLTGDPRQLGAVEAGGVMDLMDGHAETFTLTEVRRFTTGWEAAASLALRDGDGAALDVYDRHGRLLGYDSLDEALLATARAVVADRLDGRSVAVVTATNDQAAALAMQVREQLIELGLVQADGILLGRDGCTAGIGDLIAARQNDYGLGVTNRGQYLVTAISDDGALTVTPVDRDSAHQPGQAPADDEPSAAAAGIVLPAQYVQEHVQLGYAGTVHASEGLTVDAGHALADGGLDPAALYVAMTRGRLRNSAHVALTTPAPGDTRPAAGTEAGGQVRLEDTTVRPSARAILQAGLNRAPQNRAATVEAELDAERLSSAGILAGRYEAVTRIACRERLDRHLDQLTTDGHLDEGTRARLAVDQSSEHLARLLRAVEQTGRNPRAVLEAAVTSGRDLTDAGSVAQVLSHRITGGRPLPTPDRDAAHAVPADISPPTAEHLHHLRGRLTQRAADLGERVATAPSVWALNAFGPVPDANQAPAARAEWIERAGLVEVHREATGWDHEHQALSVMPGLSATERRASYTAAWNALGQPETGLDATTLTEGQLRVRVRAGETERAWAPPHADAALRAAETAAENARHAAAIAHRQAEHARQLGDDQAAAVHDAEAAAHEQDHAARRATIEPLTRIAETRQLWAASAAMTLEQEAHARAELERRGITLGAEPDRAPTSDWLHQHTSGGRPEGALVDRQVAAGHDDRESWVTETDFVDELGVEVNEVNRRQQPPDDLDLLPEAPTAPPGRPGVDTLARSPERGWGRTPAHAILPTEVSRDELDLATSAAALALARAGDRSSQEAAHVRAEDLDEPTGTDAAAGIESYDEGRRRRDRADVDAAHTADSAGHHAGDQAAGDLNA